MDPRTDPFYPNLSYTLPTPDCLRCVDANATQQLLYARIAGLEASLARALEDKTDAWSTARFLLKDHVAAGDSNLSLDHQQFIKDKVFQIFSYGHVCTGSEQTVTPDKSEAHVKELLIDLSDDDQYDFTTNMEGEILKRSTTPDISGLYVGDLSQDTRMSLMGTHVKAPANTYDVVPRHTHRFVGWDKNIPSIPSNPSGVDSLNKQYGKSDVTESTLRHLFPDDGFTGLYTEDQHTLGTSTGDMRTVSKNHNSATETADVIDGSCMEGAKTKDSSKAQRSSSLSYGRLTPVAFSDTTSLETSSNQDIRDLVHFNMAQNVVDLKQHATSLTNPKWRLEKRGTSDEDHEKRGTSDEDYENAIYINKWPSSQDERESPDFYEYGIHFVPDAYNSNFHRTIVISNIPEHIDLEQVLLNVDGGVIVQADILDSVSITGSKTAMIVFLDDRAAMAYQENALQNAIIFDGHQASVTLLSTPTWPMNRRLSKAIYDKGHTRSLLVSNFPANVEEADFRQYLRVHKALKNNEVVRFCDAEDNKRVIDFSSIWFAQEAKRRLEASDIYRQCRVTFIPDSCDLGD